MMFIIPTTSALHTTPYLSPEPYEYSLGHGNHPYSSPHSHSHCGAPRYATQSYSSRADFFHRPSAEELEEREYQRALEVIANRRRRQAENEAVIRRQRLAEAARQQYFSALAELERQRQEELLAARRAEFVRSQQARARLAVPERQHAPNRFLCQPKGPQQTTCPPCVTKRKPLADVLKQRLAAESDADITGAIKGILSSLVSPPVGSKPENSREEDPSKLIESLLSSFFHGLTGSSQAQPAPSPEQVQPAVPDKGKGKARAVDVEQPQKPAEKSKPADDAFANILRHVMEISKSVQTPRSAEEAGPSGSSHTTPPARPTVSENEQAQVDRAIALSSVEHIQSTLTKLRSDFVLPSELEFYGPSADDHDETASVSSVSSSDLTKLIPYTRANKPVYKYENELNGLLLELDRIDSRGDAEVREKRREVVNAVEKALENVEVAVGEAVGKRLSLMSTPAHDESLKGFDVDDTVTEAISVQDQPEILVDVLPVPEPSPRVHTEVIAPVEVPSPVEQSVPEPDIIVETSTVTITPTSVDPKPESESQLEPSSFKQDPLLPIRKHEQVDTDTEDEVVSLDSDAEKSAWSEVEH